jgi:hypothetical protein
MQSRVRCRYRDWHGGVLSYPLEKIYQEVAYISYHFHWSLDSILEMEHKECQIWIREISEINKQINESRSS